MGARPNACGAMKNGTRAGPIARPRRRGTRAACPRVTAAARPSAAARSCPRSRSGSFAAEARILHAAVRHVVDAERWHVVDHDAADLQLVHARCACASESVNTPARSPKSLPFTRASASSNRSNFSRIATGPNASLPVQVLLVPDVFQQRRLEHRAIDLAARDDLRARRDGRIHPVRQPARFGFGDHRTDERRRILRVAHLQRARLRDQLSRSASYRSACTRIRCTPMQLWPDW